MISRYHPLFEQKKRFLEFTLADLKSGILDDFRKPFAKERISIKGTETGIAKVFDARAFGDNIRFYWSTPGTFDKTVKVVDPNTLSKKFSENPFYTIEVEIVDLKKWLDTINLKEVGLKEFRDVLTVADAKIWCSCISFQFGGHNFEASELDSSIYPTDIPPKVTSKKYKDAGYGSIGIACKHLSNLVRNITFYYPAMLKQLRKIE